MNNLLALNHSKYLLKRSFPKLCLLGVFIPLLLATHAVGAVISWQTPVNVDINDPTQVLNNGTPFLAGSLYVYFATGVPITVNGITFGNFENAHMSIPMSTWAGGGTSATDYSTVIDWEYQLNNSTAATSSAVISGLTPGTTYQMQLWVGYLASDHATRFSASAPNGATDSTAPNESASVQVGNNSTLPSQYVVGTFTASGTTQSLYYYGNGGSSAGIGDFAAYSILANPVPEPQTWALTALGASVILFRLRRKQRAVE